MRAIGLVLLALIAFAARAGADEAGPISVAPAKIDVEAAPPGRLPWTVFDERQGLPQHTIVDMLVDQRGFVWAATQDGAARFDGRAWETVPLPRSMNSNYVRAMATARDGGLWFGSFDGGLAYLRDGAWKVFDKRHGLPSNRIRGLLETQDATGTVLWIATDAGVARLQNGRLKVYGAASGLPDLDVEGLCETSEISGTRSLIVGTANGLARLVGDRFVPIPVPSQLLGHSIYDIVESPGLKGEHALWIASYGGGIGVYERGSWAVLDTSSGLPSNVEVLTKSHARDGSPALWIGSEGGLLRFEHGRFTLYDERSGLPIRIIWKVLETTSPGGPPTLWLGTWGGGIVRLTQNGWTAFDASVGMPSGATTSVLLTKDEHGADVIWAGTSDGELARLAGDRFRSVELPTQLRHAIIFSLTETHADDGTPILWLGSLGGGIGRLENGHWDVLDVHQLPNEKVYRVLESKDEDGAKVMWVSTTNGIGRLAHGQWTIYREAEGLPSANVGQLLETIGSDGTRTLWAGTSRGIARFAHDRWQTVTAEGLLNNNVATLSTTRDPDGTRWLWVGTFAGGAARLRIDDPHARWQSFTTRNTAAMPSDNVLSIAADAGGRVYLCTTRGIARLTPRVATANDAQPFAQELFTSEDGLPSSDCQQAARLVDEYGRLWFGTARGLAMFDPRQEIPDRAAKPLRIESAGLISDHSLLLHGGESLAYDQRNLTFTSALLAWGGESRIRYRYQLAGFDPAPSEWTAAGVKEYTNLGAGDYEFRVWGRDARGHLSGPERLAFHIRPAPWLTVWAYAGYVLLALLLASILLQWRLRALAHRTRQLEGMVAERTHDLVAARDQLEQLATTDALTGVANRRKFDATLQREWGLARRDSHYLSLILLDVDFFKRYNDRYGHGDGDQCLRAVAQALAKTCTRPTDLVARYGGEEFVLVLPETDAEGTRDLLRAILTGVDALQIEHLDSTCAPHVTISLGAVTLKPGHDTEPHAALERADQLLYRAKEGGRHRAVHEDETGRISEIIP